MNQLVHCIYASLAIPTFGEDALAPLLEQARNLNGKCGLTGVLLYIDGSFFQVLEGAAGAVYGKIVRDPRHTGSH